MLWAGAGKLGKSDACKRHPSHAHISACATISDKGVKALGSASAKESAEPSRSGVVRSGGQCCGDRSTQFSEKGARVWGACLGGPKDRNSMGWIGYDI